MRRILVLASVALSASAVVLNAQMPDGSSNRAAIGKLGFMVGRWTGEAWMQRGSERVQTTMPETVERKLDGVVLQVEGRGVIPAAGAESRVSCITRSPSSRSMPGRARTDSVPTLRAACSATSP